MPITLNGDTGIQTPMYNGTITANAVTPSVNMKNRLINSAMVIDQRNAGSSTTPSGTATNIYLLDRWAYLASQASKFTFQQNAGSVTPPVGFTNYLGATVNATATVGSGDYFWLSHSIEGYNIGDLGFGTANAKTVTVSFWVRSSLTGTFVGGLTNANGGTSASSRCYPFTYTISAANTWEQKSVTITGDTSGTWNGSTNAIGMALILGLGVGSSYTTTAGSWAGSYYCANGGTNIVSNSGATFYITGVQLEVGSTATSFDYRPYGTELALCQRYYQQITGGALGVTYSTTAANWGQAFPIQMRASPTCAVSAALAVDEIGAATRTQSSSAVSATSNAVTPEAFNVFTANFSSFTAGRPLALLTTGGKFTFSAEL
jgi:hypothetical protein